MLKQPGGARRGGLHVRGDGALQIEEADSMRIFAERLREEHFAMGSFRNLTPSARTMDQIAEFGMSRVSRLLGISEVTPTRISMKQVNNSVLNVVTDAGARDLRKKTLEVKRKDREARQRSTSRDRAAKSVELVRNFRDTARNVDCVPAAKVANSVRSKARHQGE